MEIAPGYRGPFTPSVKFNYKTVNGLINRVLSLAGGKGGGGNMKLQGEGTGGGGLKQYPNLVAENPFPFCSLFGKKCLQDVCSLFVCIHQGCTAGNTFSTRGKRYLFKNLFANNFCLPKNIP